MTWDSFIPLFYLLAVGFNREIRAISRATPFEPIYALVHYCRVYLTVEAPDDQISGSQPFHNEYHLINSNVPPL